MAKKAGRGRSAALQRAIGLLNVLLEGGELDRQMVANRCTVGLATADRDLRALSRVCGVVSERRGKRKVFRFDTGRLLAAPGFSSVIAACFGASLSSVFVGSVYEKEMREALVYLLTRTRRRKEFQEVERKFLFVRRGGEMSLPERSGELDDLIDATLHCQYVIIDYRHFDDRKESIRVQPLSLAIYDHQLYVLARSSGSQPYPYRFSRIEDVSIEDETFAYPDVVEYDPRQIFEDGFGIFISNRHDVEEVEILLDRRWKVYAMTHRWHGSQTTDLINDGVRVKLRVRICPELEAWILGFGEEARVLAPTSLREKLAERVNAMAKHYA